MSEQYEYTIKVVETGHMNRLRAQLNAWATNGGRLVGLIPWRSGDPGTGARVSVRAYVSPTGQVRAVPLNLAHVAVAHPRAPGQLMARQARLPPPVPHLLADRAHSHPPLCAHRALP